MSEAVSQTKYVYPKNTDNILFYYANVLNTKVRQLYSYYYSSPEFDANSVLENIYIGSFSSLFNLKMLEELKITHIIVSIQGYNPTFPDKFSYLVVDTLDSVNTEMSDIFDHTNSFIDKAIYDDNGTVLVVCQAGISRSSTILAGYLIKTFGIPSHTAIDLIHKARNIVSPNKNFRKQLQEYYKKCIEI